MLRYGWTISALLMTSAMVSAALPTGYTPTVTVSDATRLDWVFAVSNRSPAKAPTDLLSADYDSKKQGYELFLPVRKNVKTPMPAVVFVSAGNDPGGWKAFEPICKELGIVFIGVRGAGNNVKLADRCRIILDCLDDVRRQVPLDPDRTYISGFSGGGRIACAIGFALPELFGGIMPIVAGGELRSEPWLRHRAIDRLSAAMITGESDFNRGEVERWAGPYWIGIGIRTKVWVQPKSGHAMPSPDTITEVVKWLEAGKDRRIALAKQSPASRSAITDVATRDQFATALFAEAKQKIASPVMLHRGLMLAKGVMERWPDTESGKAARTLLEGYEAQKGQPWEVDDVAELRRDLLFKARGLSDYVVNGIPANSPYTKMRPEMAGKAIEWWSALIEDSPNSDVAKEGKKWIGELKPIAGKK